MNVVIRQKQSHLKHDAERKLKLQNIYENILFYINCTDDIYWTKCFLDRN